MKNSTIVLIASLLLGAISMKAQCNDPNVFCQDTALYYTCLGTFMDNDGNGAYLEVSSSLTFCPETAGFRANIEFVEFDLDQDIMPDNADQLVIYDGTSEADPLIGIYTGAELLGQTISASNGNPSGCLLVQFVAAGSINSSHTGWSANVSCSQPCTPPVAVASVVDATAEGELFLMCLNNEVTFSGIESSAAEGHVLANFTWDFKDGNATTTSESTINHSYVNDAIYDVHLTVTDDVGCAAETIIHLGVVGPPIINLPNDLSACVGTEVDLLATFEAQSINNSSNQINEIDLFIPDDQSQCYTTEIFVSGYQASTTVGSCDDLESLSINIEHSFIGDLVITLFCPNGQSVILHQQGGGGTWLGEPIDDESSLPGIGYDYSWSSDASETWAESVGSANLASGDYAPVESFCQLIGCPLNGVWSLEVCDLWSIDNGNIFSWGIGLATSNNVQALQYTPTIEVDATSSFWSGDAIVSLDENADNATINTQELGELEFNYTTIDNGGCTFTEDFTVNVIENPIILSLDEYFIYDELNTYLFPQTSGLELPNGLQWSWTPAEGLSNPNAQYTEVLLPNDNESYTVTATSQTLLGCSASETIGMGLPELVLSGYIFYDTNGNGIFDSAETPIPYFPYSTNNGTLAFSDENGFYSAFCVYGSNTVTLEVDESLWNLTTPSSFTTILNDGQNESINNNFGIIPNGNPQTVLSGEISNSSTWCLFQNNQILSVSNDGNTQPSGYIVYTYDPLCNFVSAEPTPDQIDGNNLYFSFTNLGFAQVAMFEVLLDMPDNAENGDLLNFELQTYYNDGVNSELVESDLVSSQLLCSYDPNDKRELNGQGELGVIAPNTTLDYVIRFQNTGSAPAIDVVLSDQLPAQLQFDSFDPIASSHPFTVSVTSAGLATFVFDNIMLPDSGSNFEASIGFVHFRIKQQPDLQNGTTIHNHAKIYFDANSPIVTNTTTTTIFECESNELNIIVNDNEIEILDAVSNVQWYFNDAPMLNIGYAITATQTGTYYASATLLNGCVANSEEISIVGVDEFGMTNIFVYPNPTHGITSLNLGERQCDIKLTNAFGQVLQVLNNKRNLVQLDLGNYSRGTYFIHITSEQTNNTLKLIVE